MITRGTRRFGGVRRCPAEEARASWRQTSRRRPTQTLAVVAAMGWATFLVTPSSLGTAVAALVQTPVYTGSVGVSTITEQLTGCGKERASTARWSATTGVVRLKDSAVAMTCGRSLAFLGGSGSGSATSSILVAIPIRAAHNGADVIASNWTIRAGSTSSFSNASCPAKKVDFHPALNEYSDGYCEAGVFTEVELFGQVEDLQNSSWTGNSSQGFALNDSNWVNTTDCFNYGTPTCTNYTGSLGYAYSFSSGILGFSALTLNGVTNLTVWDNATHMLRSHHYVLTFEILVTADAFAGQGGLGRPWVASALQTVNLATLGDGATLNSITVS